MQENAAGSRAGKVCPVMVGDIVVIMVFNCKLWDREGSLMIKMVTDSQSFSLDASSFSYHYPCK